MTNDPRGPIWLESMAAVLLIAAILAIALWKLRIAILAILVVWLALGYARSEELIEPTPQEAIDIQTWIPAACCRTNGCCRKVHESALISLPKNEIRVASTGQVLPRTGWSQDKNTWRCTCDFIEGKWVVHPQAKTRCVFDHPNGS